MIWWRFRTGDPVIGMFVLSAVLTHLIITLSMPLGDFQAMIRRSAWDDWAWLCVVIGGYFLYFWAAIDSTLFVTWRKRSPFAITGWAAVVDDPCLEHDQWRHCSIIINLKKDTDDVRIGLKALSDVFALSANRSYYTAESAEEGRKRNPWIGSEVGATGTANSRVVWKMYKFLSGPLREFQNVTGAIESVQLELSGESFYVSRPSAD
ncbi:MAG: hypothetical protein K8S54_00765 [Spirochaetia bacterium]|nr:hypothetical protein [Spirochaetia bacterium]